MNSVTELLKAFAELLKGAAWPVAIIIVVIILRKEIARVMERLSRFKYKDMEASFEVRKLLDEAEQHFELQELPPPPPPPPPGPPRSFASLVKDGLLTQTREYKSLLGLARISPRAAVVEAWSMVEVVTMALAEFSDIPPKVRDSGIVMMDLANKELASPRLVDLYRKLYGVRHEATYNPSFHMDEREAVRYLAVTLRLAAELQMLEEDLRTRGKDE